MHPEVELIPLDSEDPIHLKIMFETRTHPKVVPLLSSAPPKDFSLHKTYLKSCDPLKKRFYMIKSGQNYAGYCQLTLGVNEMEFGFTLHPLFWNQGIGSRGVQDLVALSFKQFPSTYLRKLFVKKENHRAIWVYEKFGFTKVREIQEKEEIEMELKRCF